jgi:hypothetical protein
MRAGLSHDRTAVWMGMPQGSDVVPSGPDRPGVASVVSLCNSCSSDGSAEIRRENESWKRLADVVSLMSNVRGQKATDSGIQSRTSSRIQSRTSATPTSTTDAAIAMRGLSDSPRTRAPRHIAITGLTYA